MDGLPEDILWRIFTYSDITDIGKYCSVNKKWHRVGYGDYLWTVLLPPGYLPVTNNLKQYIDKWTLNSIDEFYHIMLNGIKLDFEYSAVCLFPRYQKEDYILSFRFSCRRNHGPMIQMNETYLFLRPINSYYSINNVTSVNNKLENREIYWRLESVYPATQQGNKLFSDTIIAIREKIKMIENNCSCTLF